MRREDTTWVRRGLTVPRGCKLAIVGATGARGKAIAEAALASGAQVKILARSSYPLPPSSEMFEVVVGDLSRPDTVVDVTRCCDAVIYTPPLTFNVDQALIWLSIVMTSAELAGVRRFVLCCTIRPPDECTGIPALDVKRALSSRVAASALETVLVRPTLYLGNLLLPAICERIVGDARQVVYPLRGDLPCQWITWEDAAVVAVQAATARWPVAQVLDVGGPETVYGHELAEKIGEGLGIGLAYRQATEDETVVGLTGLMGEAAAREVVKLYEWLNTAGQGSLLARETVGRVHDVIASPIAHWAGAQCWNDTTT